jgi:hypothetical protein
MPFVPHPLIACHPHKPCTGDCTGYESRSTCPPLIVLAVIAASQAVAAATTAAGASR